MAVQQSTVVLKKKESMGSFLTILIILGLIASTPSAILYFLYFLIFRPKSVDSIAIFMDIVDFIITYALIGTWKRKKKAVYILFPFIGIYFTFVVGIVLFLVRGAVSAILALLLLYIIWFLALKRKWHLFA